MVRESSSPRLDPIEEGTNRYLEWEQGLMEEVMATPQSRGAYALLVELFDLCLNLVDARREVGLTQKEVARRTGLSMRQVRRMEDGDMERSCLKALKRYAEVVGKRLCVTLVDILPNKEQ